MATLVWSSAKDVYLRIWLFVLKRLERISHHAAFNRRKSYVLFFCAPLCRFVVLPIRNDIFLSRHDSLTYWSYNRRQFSPKPSSCFVRKWHADIGSRHAVRVYFPFKISPSSDDKSNQKWKHGPLAPQISGCSRVHERSSPADDELWAYRGRFCIARHQWVDWSLTLNDCR